MTFNDPPSLWDRVVRGNALRRSRFHDEKGTAVGVAGVLHAPLAFGTAAIKVLTGWRPSAPMISFSATRRIERLLDRDARVVEFGSGLSTLWFAARCGWLFSVEDDPAWHLLVSGLLAQKGYRHVQYELRPAPTYADLSRIADDSVDFALVDGTDRAGCIQSAVPKIRRGGWLYLDNSDKDMTRPDADLRRAETALRAAVARRGGSIESFTDFSPANFFAEEGLLVHFE